MAGRERWDSRTAFDRFLWIAPVSFAVLFVVAFSLARMGKPLAFPGNRDILYS